MAKDPTSQDDRVSPQKAPRKPLTIDLPAAEIGRKAGEGVAASSASSAAAASSTSTAEAAKVNEPSKPAPEKEPLSGKGGERSGPADPVIPSAFATRKADPGTAPKETKPGAPPDRQAASGDRSRSFIWFLLASFAGGVIAAIVVIAFTLAGYFSPVSEDTSGTDVAAEIAALKNEVAELRRASGSRDLLEARIAALESSVGDLANRAPTGGDDAAALKEMQDRVAALESAGPAVGPNANLEPRIAELSREIAALKSAVPPNTGSLETALADLRQQVDALSAKVDAVPGEERVAAIETKLDETSGKIETAAALAPAVAADSLAAALDSGRPFAAELAALKSLGIDAEAVNALAPQADTGLPTIADLRSRFETALESVALSTPVPENTGAIDRLLQSARGLVEVRPAHPTAGSDPAAIVARIRGALSAGDLKTALAEWSALPETIKTPTADWAKAAQSRLEADDLVARVRTAALSQLGAKK